VNLGHEQIDAGDIDWGEEAYSSELLNNVAFEIRDVFPAGADTLYEFIEAAVELSGDRVREVLTKTVGADKWGGLFDLLLWYGFLGIVREDGEVAYIYDVKYDIKRLNALVRKRGDGGATFRINPAFWKALEVRH
jgi:hypothetical protein